MTNRKFEVTNGNVVSNDYDRENGIHQGSKISVTLILIAINSVMNNIDSQSYKYMHHTNHLTIGEHLQRTTGFIFSATKSNMVHFCRK